MRKYLNFRVNIALGLIFAFLLNFLGPIPLAQAQEFSLPAPGTMVQLSPEFNPPILKGLKVHSDNPFRFEFILDQGDSNTVIPGSSTVIPAKAGIQTEATKLIKYFLASLTIPEKDLWVNLSPYEKNRIVPQSFGLTEMGRDLLAEDYMLKQITASLIYPEDEIGKKFWKRIYAEAAKKFGTTNIPVNTFNKVWIVPEKAVVYENAKVGTAYVVEEKLKVMLEQDYLALSHGVIPAQAGIHNKNDINALGSQIVREIVIPELTEEVNSGRNFAQLRQVYNSLILATWYKKKIKDSILAQVYANKNKVAGIVSLRGSVTTEAIYQRYLQAFKKGVYNYIKEDQDPLTQQVIPRKYFSGGALLINVNAAMAITPDQRVLRGHGNSDHAMRVVDVQLETLSDQAMKVVTPQQMERAAEARRARAKQLFVNAKPFASSVTFIEDLKHHNVKMAVVSSNHQTGETLKRAGLSGKFLFVIDGGKFKEKGLPEKTDPELWKIMAREMGNIDPADSWVVEDGEDIVEAAHNAGFKVLALARDNNAQRMRDKHANIVVEDVSDLTAEQLDEIYSAEGVIFDSDGVIMNTEHLQRQSWREMLESHFGETGFSDQDFAKHTPGKSGETGLKNLLTSRGYTLNSAQLSREDQAMNAPPMPRHWLTTDIENHDPKKFIYTVKVLGIHRLLNPRVLRGAPEYYSASEIDQDHLMTYGGATVGLILEFPDRDIAAVLRYMHLNIVAMNKNKQALAGFIEKHLAEQNRTSFKNILYQSVVHPYDELAITPQELIEQSRDLPPDGFFYAGKGYNNEIIIKNSPDLKIKAVILIARENYNLEDILGDPRDGSWSKIVRSQVENGLPIVIVGEKGVDLGRIRQEFIRSFPGSQEIRPFVFRKPQNKIIGDSAQLTDDRAMGVGPLVVLAGLTAMVYHFWPKKKSTLKSEKAVVEFLWRYLDRKDEMFDFVLFNEICQIALDNHYSPTDDSIFKGWVMQKLRGEKHAFLFKPKYRPELLGGKWNYVIDPIVTDVIKKYAGGEWINGKAFYNRLEGGAELQERDSAQSAFEIKPPDRAMSLEKGNGYELALLSAQDHDVSNLMFGVGGHLVNMIDDLKESKREDLAGSINELSGLYKYWKEVERDQHLFLLVRGLLNAQERKNYFSKVKINVLFVQSSLSQIFESHPSMGDINIFRSLLTVLDHFSTYIMAIAEGKFAFDEVDKLPVDLNDVIKKSISLVQEKENISVIRNFSPKVGQVPVDAFKFGHVIMNLVRNAQIAIGDNQRGKITIRTRLDGAWAKTTITDNGSGIRPENMVKIFDPFFTTRPEDKGTGLGLFICKQIIEAHGGTLTAENNKNGLGATFTIRLPLDLAMKAKTSRRDFLETSVRAVIVAGLGSIMSTPAAVFGVGQRDPIAAAADRFAIKILKQDVFDAFINDLHSPDTDVRLKAVRSSRYENDNRVVEALCRALRDDPDLGVRREIVDVLNGRNEPMVAKTFKLVLQDEEFLPKLIPEIKRALKNMEGSKAVFAGKQRESRTKFLKPEQIDALEKLLQDNDLKLRIKTVRSLRQKDGPRLVEIMCEALRDDPDLGVRKEIINDLEGRSDSVVVRTFGLILQDEKLLPELRPVVVNALKNTESSNKIQRKISSKEAKKLKIYRDPEDQAMTGVAARTRGGIDFTAGKTPLEVRNAGKAIKFYMDPAQLAQLQNAPGFVPVIINIQPLTDLRAFLGISQVNQ